MTTLNEPETEQLEFVPPAIGGGGATTSMSNGHWLRVDGTAGTVTW